MPAITLAQLNGVTLDLELNATSTQAIGLTLTGTTLRPMRFVLLEDDQLSTVRTFTLPAGTTTQTVTLTNPQRRLFAIGSVVNTHGETVQIMTRPFYRIEVL